MDYSIFAEKMNNEFRERIGLSLSETQINAFYFFMNYLIEKNKVMNLTAITEPDEIILRHFIDSCMPIKFLELKGKKVVDVGTGAGFPGMPLAIALPDTEFVLTDTLGKRINFLNEVNDEIKLKNAQFIKARVEDFAHDGKFREKFDYVMARGVARLSVLSEYSLPLVKVSGQMIAYKMDDCDDELKDGEKAIKTLGGMFHVKHSYNLVDDEPKRCIIEIDKIKATDKKYPRQAGMPSKKPIE